MTVSYFNEVLGDRRKYNVEDLGWQHKMLKCTGTRKQYNHSLRKLRLVQTQAQLMQGQNVYFEYVTKGGTLELGGK